MECTIIFTRNKDGEIEMYRQVERSIAQEGDCWDESMKVFGNRLVKTLRTLGVDDKLVLHCELQKSPRGKDIV